MANPRLYNRSFAGGEMSPEFFARVDDAKHIIGLETCHNFVVKPHGAVENRAGFKFVNEVKDSSKATRIIPFVFSSDQTVVIEVGEGYFRFHSNGATVGPGTPAAWLTATGYEVGDLVSNGGTNYYCTEDHTSGTFATDVSSGYWYAMPSGIYEIPNNYAAADLGRINFIQSNDVLTLVHPGYPAQELRRYGTTNWTLEQIAFQPAISAPTGVSATATPGGTPGTPSVQEYTVTAVDGPEESLAGIASSVGAAITNITQANPAVITLIDTGGSASFSAGDTVYIRGVGGMSEIDEQFYEVTNYTYLAGVGTMEIEDTGTGTPIDSSAFSAYTGGGTISVVGGATCSNNLFDDGAFNTIVWSAVPGAERYYVYKKTSGLYAYIGQTEELTFKDDNIAGDISKTPPIYEDNLAIANARPGAVGYFEQRRCFAGSTNKPANFWATRSGTESNLSYSIPQSDDDSVRFAIAARERNEIRHIVPMNNLVLLTEAGEWRVTGADGGVLTPDVSLRPQSFIGSDYVQPVLVNNNLIFAAARGGHVRELAYSWEASGYLTGDLSLRASHLFDQRTIIDMSYSKAPIPVVWIISSTGELLGFTYVPEQQVGAWHRHSTLNGVFEHIAVVAEGNEDVLYAVVRRTIGGSTVRYIERMASRAFSDVEDCFFVDSGLSYDGAPATTFSNLDHLEGEDVTVLADGAHVGTFTVSSGQVTIPEAASVVHIGLPITADLKTLPMAFEVPGYGQGQQKNISRVFLHVYKSRNIKAGDDTTRLYDVKARGDELYGTPPSLKTGQYEVVIDGSWGQDGQVTVRQDLPLPLTLLSITTEFVPGG